jgi:hypothetical protein
LIIWLQFTLNFEGDLINTSRERFENRCNQAPIPELATEEWLARCAFPLGMDDNGNFFELEYVII